MTVEGMVEVSRNFARLPTFQPPSLNGPRDIRHAQPVLLIHILYKVIQLKRVPSGSHTIHHPNRRKVHSIHGQHLTQKPLEPPIPSCLVQFRIPPPIHLPPQLPFIPILLVHQQFRQVVKPLRPHIRLNIHTFLLQPCVIDPHPGTLKPLRYRVFRSPHPKLRMIPIIIHILLHIFKLRLMPAILHQRLAMNPIQLRHSQPRHSLRTHIYPPNEG